MDSGKTGLFGLSDLSETVGARWAYRPNNIGRLHRQTLNRMAGDTLLLRLELKAWTGRTGLDVYYRGQTLTAPEEPFLAPMGQTSETIRGPK